MPRGHYVVAARMAHAAAFALAGSILLNCLGILVHFSWLHGTYNPMHRLYDTKPIRLALDLRSVALEVVDSDRYGMHDDNDWASVIPLGHGFVRFGEGENQAYYAVSMYHQMHCLNSFRKMFNGRNASRTNHDGQHALHCLSYLRQMVLCSADITLEPAFSARNVDGRKTQAAYGTGVTHECRDWVQVRKHVEQNHEQWEEEEKIYVATEASAVQPE
ncbi:hypothetical protein OE88DRAFT_627544 [Heliocybe sulcata]|uniref:Uncharacterized protein n=1 Tax=Heliocybe sulcata TaxID=5364 RepID=A0A5C3NCT4_9AGAM|nr:hypothetical protein OE88DRAFT_627544 [Heliocybe sulcata]